MNRMITSAQNARIKWVRSLGGRARDRREAGAFLAEGVRLVEEALAAGWPFRFVLYGEGISDRGRELVRRLAAAGVETEQVSDALIRSLGETETTQGLLAVLTLQSLPPPPVPDLVLIPDRVREPGNLGVLLRTAAAAGAQAAWLAPETTDAFSPKALRAGMGAQFRLPVRTMTWEEIESACQAAGLALVLAAMDGVPCWDLDLRGPLALIVGGEAEGAGEQAQKAAARRIGIPMPGGMESLNAGSAGAVLLFEAVRQRRAGGCVRDPRKIG
jgi:TrmH family RNA methyltransferase